MFRVIKEKPRNLIVFIMIILSLNLFSFSYLDLKTYQNLHLVMLIFLFAKFKPVSRIKGYSANYVYLIMLIPLLSIYSCHELNGQSYFASTIVYRMHLTWLFYFFLWRYNFEASTLYRILFLISLIYIGISLLQQITYPFAPFGERTIGTKYAEFFSGNIEKRFGLYRFFISGYLYCVFFLLYEFSKRRINKKIIVFLLVGIILTGARQVIIATIISMLYYKYLYNKKKSIYIIIYIAFIALLYIVSSSYFSEIERIESDFEEGRSLSYLYYINKIIESPLSFLMGNGLGHSSSLYGRQIDQVGGVRVIVSDIGTIGSAYYYGIFYVLIYYIIYIRYLMNKLLSNQLKSLIVFFFIISFMFTTLWEVGNIMCQAILIYLCDKNIYDKKKNISK